ncbi:MAG: Ig-like domain-containing protein [Bacteroidota bacterium]
MKVGMKWALLGALLLSGCGIQVYEYPMENGSGWTLPALGVPNATPKPSTQSPDWNRNPLITSFTANPLNAVEPGQAITFAVDVLDEDHDTLKYTWTATGGTLSTNTGRMVSWVPPARAGIYTILVSISDGKGGTAEGAQNVIVRSSGVPAVSGQPAIVNEDATASVQ